LPAIDRLAQRATEAPEAETKAREMEATARALRQQQVNTDTAFHRLFRGGRPRQFRQEFLTPTAGAPRMAIELEEIGNDPTMRGWAKFGLDVSPDRAWIAQLVGIDGRGGYTRAFLRAPRDYSRANSRGTRGVYRCFTLEEGLIYEINQPVNWKSNDRRIVHIMQGAEHAMTERDLVACVAS
jgi:hypothetical protein